MTNAKTAPAEEFADREIVITRVFDAPRELVWNAWTDPKQIVRWWGPRGFITTIHEMDVRPGGVWKSTMHGPDGTDYPSQSVFVEVVKPERIVYSLGGARKVSPAINLRRRGVSKRKATRPNSLYECSSHRPRCANMSPGRMESWKAETRRLIGSGSIWRKALSADARID